ncbi:hypothetical protein Barb6XT_02382 [Bacteroidales bacterium Barb6XT]|nr:hypothetical protein Barb6XT_02382 [Bacteroidales bacterium Barb6XT]
MKEQNDQGCSMPFVNKQEKFITKKGKEDMKRQLASSVDSLPDETQSHIKFDIAVWATGETTPGPLPPGGIPWREWLAQN